jgi:hypothetical protein
MRVSTALFLLLASCGPADPKATGSTVTVTLPPPKAAVPAPGFSTPVRDGIG